ncbi:hypothetical protein GF358_00120 [Candidatus Woesearchaeota archaeon]|nr:hypothetical protein [Candidatus Woesearchaeota archaeon]
MSVQGQDISVDDDSLDKGVKHPEFIDMRQIEDKAEDSVRYSNAGFGVMCIPFLTSMLTAGITAMITYQNTHSEEYAAVGVGIGVVVGAIGGIMIASGVEEKIIQNYMDDARKRNTSTDD